MARPKHPEHLWAVVAAVAVGALPSCSKGPEPKGPESAETPEKIELRLHLEPGKTYKLQITSEQKIIQSLEAQGSRQETPQTTGFGLSHHVKEVRDDGTAVVQVTYDSLQFKQEGPMGNVDYDSSTAGGAESSHPMAKALATLVGGSFELDLTRKGDVTRVEGADSLAAQVMENIKVPIPVLRPVIEQQVKQQFGDQAMKELMEQMIGVYPEGPVGIGDSWSRRIAVTRGFAAILNNTWTVNQSLSGELTMKGGPGGDAAVPIAIEGVTRVTGQ